MDPYDADAALDAIRPRLIAARTRRRRAVGASAGLVLFAMSSVAAASILSPDDDTSTVVAVSPDQEHDVVDEPSPVETPQPDSHIEGLDEDGAGGGVDQTPPPDASTKEPEVELVETTTTTAKPTTTTTTTKPTTTTTTKPAPPPPPPKESTTTTKLEHDGSHKEPEPSCDPEPGTSVHAAPSDAGTVTVQVDGSGTLSLVAIEPAEGWSAEVLHEKPDAVKVSFSTDGKSAVWIQVKLVDCELKVASG